MKQNKTMKRSVISCLIILAAMLTSCDVYDDLNPCPKGISLHFMYDYNMEYADAFPQQVDCLTLYIYDEDGNYVETRTETGEILQDESYSMTIDLEEGSYRLVAYGGLECDEHTFSVDEEPAEGSLLTDLNVRMHHDNLTSNIRLHDLFYGAIDVKVEGEMYKDVTLPMMKNTNSIRVVLQQADTEAEPLNIEDFDIRITDDNTLMGHDNAVISSGTVTYSPWTQGDGTVVGGSEEGTQVSVAQAEFSTSRLVTENEPYLTVYSKLRQETVVNIPLIRYLLLLKSERYAGMEDQEYLDRESDWSIIFLLNDYTWHDVEIRINDWTVRLNETSF